MIYINKIRNYKTDRITGKMINILLYRYIMSYRNTIIIHYNILMTKHKIYIINFIDLI